MSKYDGAMIEVINWSEFNPRTDSKRPSWFRMESAVALGSGFHGLSTEVKWMWVVILSLVCEKNGQPIKWNSSYVEALTGIKPKTQDCAIETFEKFVRLRVSRTDSHVELKVPRVNSPATRRDETRRDERDEEVSSEHSDERFRAIPAYFSLDQVFRERKLTNIVQGRIFEAFPDTEWVVEEIRKALAWEAANPTRKKKNFAAFITRWLTKGWDQRRVVIQTAKQERPVSKIAQEIRPERTNEQCVQNAEKIRQIRQGILKSIGASESEKETNARNA